MKTTTHKGITMTPIGQWLGLAIYYAGSDGNAWSWHRSGGWTNNGSIDTFRSRFARMYRGELFN